MGNEGWIKLHRSIMDDELWLSEPFTRSQAWIDLIMLANHEIGHIRKRGILIEVGRGEVGYAEQTLAMRWRWKSRGKVRRFLQELEDRGTITRNPVQQNPKLTNLIRIKNYDFYQSNGHQTDIKRTSNEHKIDTNKNEKKKKNEKTSSSGILKQIYALKERYPDQGTIARAFAAIASTRKSGSIPDSLKLAILRTWENYPVEHVIDGIKTYLAKGYHLQGKKEDYLLGIIRNNCSNNQKGEIPAGSVPTRRPTGSPLLDEFYRHQGERII